MKYGALAGQLLCPRTQAGRMRRPTQALRAACDRLLAGRYDGGHRPAMPNACQDRSRMRPRKLLTVAILSLLSACFWSAIPPIFDCSYHVVVAVHDETGDAYSRAQLAVLGGPSDTITRD